MSKSSKKEGGQKNPPFFRLKPKTVRVSDSTIISQIKGQGLSQKKTADILGISVYALKKMYKTGIFNNKAKIHRFRVKTEHRNIAAITRYKKIGFYKPKINLKKGIVIGKAVYIKEETGQILEYFKVQPFFANDLHDAIDAVIDYLENVLTEQSGFILLDLNIKFRGKYE